MKLTFEQQMQMLSPELQEKYYQEQKAEWDKTAFNIALPVEHRRFALSFEHPVSLNVHAEYFKWLWQAEIAGFNLSDAVTFCRAANRTFAEYINLYPRVSESAVKYADYISFVEQYTNQVNELLEPIKERLMKKMLALQKLQMNAGNRQIALS